jgi:hypothetical protein
MAHFVTSVCPPLEQGTVPKEGLAEDVEIFDTWLADE